MSWAEIKKAVNSDISTPLNEQLQSFRDYLSQNQVAFTQYTPSDANEYILGENIEGTTQTTYTAPNEFTATYGGTVRINYKATATSSSSTVCTIHAGATYDDGKTYTTLRSVTVLENTTESEGTLDVDVAVGGRIRIQYSNGYGRRSILIKASVSYSIKTTKMPTVSGVRKIQRGIVKLPQYATSAGYSVSNSPLYAYASRVTLSGFNNPSKMVVNLIGDAGQTVSISSANYLKSFPAYVREITNAYMDIGILFTSNNAATGYTTMQYYPYISYEVIEYY